MKENNRLNKALKDALQEQAEPLREAQWEKLSFALGGEKPKRRFLPWFIMFSVVALSSLAVGYWLGVNNGEGQLSGGNKIENGIADHSNSGNIADKNQLADKNNRDNVIKYQATGTTSAGENEADKAGANKSGTNKNSRSNSKSTLQAGERDNLAGGQTPDPQGSSAEKDSDKTSGPDDQLGNTNLSGLEFKLPLMPLHKMKTSPISDSVPSLLALQNELNTRKDKEPGPDQERARFAFGLSTGISPVQFKVTAMENNEKLHKDSRSVFDQSNRNSRSNFVNLSFDWFVLKNFALSFSSGFQYREIVQEININYEYKEIPFRAVDGTIIQYVPDTFGKPLTIQQMSTNRLRFISLPLKVGYTLPLSSKDELQLTGGISLSKMTKAEGSTFAINESTVKPLATSYKNPFNVGLIGGLQYSRNVYRHWWLGLEAQRQQNTMKYDAYYGVIKSHINISNYSLHLKYKF